MSDSKSFLGLVLQLTWLVSLSEAWLFSTNSNCYERPNVGCFPITSPFNNAMGVAPQSPEQVDVRFIHKTDAGDLQFSLDQTQQAMYSRFNSSVKTVVIIHGYLESPNRRWIRSMVDELARQGPKNIFVVDWRGGSNLLNYFQCVANARMAGAIIALFLQELMTLGGVAFSFHLIGFSLGAQVAGYAGSRTPGLGRITGLDPAGPGFLNTHPSVRLDPTDAVVVDAVHTDNELGTLLPFGTVDFYPNGGSNQPACGSGTISRLSSFIARLDFSRNSLTRTVGCSHIRAVELFTASINHPCVFPMKRCNGVRDIRRDNGLPCTDGECPQFGYHFDFFRTPITGLYRFPTSGSVPYCCKLSGI